MILHISSLPSPSPWEASIDSHGFGNAVADRHVENKSSTEIKSLMHIMMPYNTDKLEVLVTVASKKNGSVISLKDRLHHTYIPDKLTACCSVTHRLCGTSTHGCDD